MASGCQSLLLPWRELLVGWGSQLPFSACPGRVAKKRLSFRSAAIFFLPPPKYHSPPVGADLFSLDSLHSLSLPFFILNLPSILSSFFQGKDLRTATMSVEQPQKVLGMPVSYHNLIFDGSPNPLDRDMPRLQNIASNQFPAIKLQHGKSSSVDGLDAID